MSRFSHENVKLITEDQMADPNEQVVTTSNGMNVHYVVDNVVNEATITGVEVSNSSTSNEVLEAVEAAEGVAETLESCGYDVRGLF